MINRIKKALLLGLSFALALSLMACSNNNVLVSEENVTLIDPVGVKTSFAVAEEFDITVSSTYSAIVYPDITEYSYETNQTFSSYAKLPGDTLKKGDNIIYANIDSLKEQIKNSNEKLQNSQESYVEYMKENSDKLAELEEDLAYYKQIVYNFEHMSEADKNSYGGRDYAFYESEYKKYDSYYRNTYISVERLKEQLKERTELYTLDYNYNLAQHKKLLEKQKVANMKADKAGVLVGITYASSGDRMNAGNAVIAVGNTAEKMLCSDYISKNIVLKAKDVYAVVNGKRYEVSYHEIDTDEYERLEEAYGSVHSTFTLCDPDNEIAFGSFASIVIVKEVREDCVCVPKEAVNKDDNGYFVLLYDGYNSAKQEVKLEQRHGSFIELSYGVKAGDKVLCEIKEVTGNKTSTVSYGTISTKFTANGYLYYPSSEWVKNPVEYGNTYVDEVCVSRYQHVEKGDVLAKVHVEMDKLSLERQERTLLRAKETLEELVESDKDKKEEDKQNTKAIEAQEEYIAELEKVIKQIKSDGKIVEIKAPISGIITDLVSYTKGDYCYSNGNIACISEENSSYIVVEDANGSLAYGNTATITYKNAEDVEKKVTGKVVTAGSNILTKNLQTGYALISIPKESIGDMAGSSMGYEGWWNRSRFSVTVETRKMGNVLLVPRTAVDESEGIYYVSVLNEDGSISTKTFIAGGFDTSNYWVVDGLTEGMVVCLE